VVVIRTAVIGAGAIARRGHLPALKLLEKEGLVEIIAIVDIKEDLARRVTKEFDIPKYYTDHNEMLRAEEPDVTIICTPTPTHFGIAKDCIEFSHLLIEKPLCIKLSEALVLRDLAEKNNRIIGEVYNYRYFPSVLKALKRVREGYLGKLVSIQGTYFTHFPVAWTRATWLYHERGVLYDGLPHMIDLMLLIGNGRPLRVSAFGGDMLEDAGFINHASFAVELDNRVFLTGVNSWIVGTSFVFMLELYGTGGFGYLDVRGDFYREYHGTRTVVHDLFYMKDEFINFARSVLSGRFFVGALAHYPILLRQFLMGVEKGEKIPVSIDDSIERLIILEGIVYSIKNKEIADRRVLLEKAEEESLKMG